MSTFTPLWRLHIETLSCCRTNARTSSDPDLPKGGATVGASVVSDATNHKRVESWELKEGRGRERRPIFERDGESIHAGSEGVKAVESV